MQAGDRQTDTDTAQLFDAPLLPYEYSYPIRHPVTDRAKPSFVIFDIRALLRSEHQSARMSKITNDGLTLHSGTGCFIAVPIWQQWASTGSSPLSTTRGAGEVLALVAARWSSWNRGWSVAVRGRMAVQYL